MKYIPMKHHVKEILNNLIKYNKPVNYIKKELIACDRNDIVDIPDELTINKADVIMVLQLFMKRQIDAHELSEWAELIEGRDGITYEDVDDEDRISMVLSWLSSPEIHGELTVERIRQYIQYLK